MKSQDLVAIYKDIEDIVKTLSGSAVDDGFVIGYLTDALGHLDDAITEAELEELENEVE